MAVEWLSTEVAAFGAEHDREDPRHARGDRRHRRGHGEGISINATVSYTLPQMRRGGGGGRARSHEARAGANSSAATSCLGRTVRQFLVADAELSGVVRDVLPSPDAIQA